MDHPSEHLDLLSEHSQPLQALTPSKQITNKENLVTANTHHKIFIKKKFKKVIWSQQEDEALQTIINQMGVGKWKDVATMIPNRSAKQCRERWHNHLRNQVKKDPWNPDQFWILALSVRALGRKWSQIGAYLPQRSDNTIKNQWNCKMKPYKAKFDEEISKLLSKPEDWFKRSSKEQELLQMIKNEGQRNQEMDQIDKICRGQNKFCEKSVICELYEEILSEALNQYGQHELQINDSILFAFDQERSLGMIEGGENIFDEQDDGFGFM